jgi:hypothetical protein
MLLSRRSVALACFVLVSAAGASALARESSMPRQAVVRGPEASRAITTVEDAYQVLRTSAGPDDKLAHAPAASEARKVVDDPERDAYIVWTPGKDLCIVVHVRSADYGGTACGPEDLAGSRPASLILVGSGSSAALMVGLAPDGVISAVVDEPEGVTRSADVSQNVYTLELPSTGRAPQPSISFVWNDGRVSRVVGTP